MEKVIFEVEMDCDPTWEVDEITELIEEHFANKNVDCDVNYRYEMKY